MPPEQNQLPTPDLADFEARATTADDGGNTAPVTFEQPAAPAAEPPKEERGEPQQWKDDKRGEIFARAREKRAAETTPFSGDANDPDALYGSDVNQDDMGELELEALRRRKEHLREVAGQPPQQQPRKPLNGLDPQLLSKPVPVIVDGQQQEVSMEDLIRDYQINRAADRRLEMAKALLQQTQEFQRTRPTPGLDDENGEQSGQDLSTDDQDDFDRELGHTSRRPGNVKDLVEKIQLGSPDEAAQALEDFISSAVNREAPVDETTRVQMALEDINTKQAVAKFAQANPQIANNQLLTMEATKVIHRGMAEDLLAAGYSMEQLRQLAPSPQHLTQLHKNARVNGVRGVRPVSDLISAGYHGAINNLRALVEQTTGAQPQNRAVNMEQRQQRKEGLQPQPVARRLSPSLSGAEAPKTQDQSRQAAFARIRQARGQSH